MNAPVSRSFVTIGGLTMDDVVLPDGSVHRGVIGGNAYYSALGARLWTDDVSVLSFAGEDFDDTALDRMSASGVDTSLVLRLDVPSIRLWILYEPDGRRQIHYQHRSSSLQLLELAVSSAAAWRLQGITSGTSVHVAALPATLQISILALLRPPPAQLTVDTIEARGSVGGDLASYRSSSGFDGVAAFLPSREEMDVVRGEMSEAAIAFSLRWHGLRVVVVKHGVDGCVVYDRVEQTVHRVPAWPSVVVDPTGAGDAFCGGFMVGLATLADPIEAALLGTVSASFAVEGLGGMHLLDVEPAVAQRRRETLRRQVVRDAA